MDSDWSVLSEDNENNRGQKNSLLGEAGPEREASVIMHEITAGFGRHGACRVKSRFGKIVNFFSRNVFEICVDSDDKVRKISLWAL